MVSTQLVRLDHFPQVSGKTSKIFENKCRDNNHPLYIKKLASKMGSLYKKWHVFVLPGSETAPHHSHHPIPRVSWPTPHPTSVIGLCSFTSTGSGGGATGGSGRAGLADGFRWAFSTTSWGRFFGGNSPFIYKGFWIHARWLVLGFLGILFFVEVL